MVWVVGSRVGSGVGCGKWGGVSCLMLYIPNNPFPGLMQDVLVCPHQVTHFPHVDL